MKKTIAEVWLGHARCGHTIKIVNVELPKRCRHCEKKTVSENEHFFASVKNVSREKIKERDEKIKERDEKIKKGVSL